MADVVEHLSDLLIAAFVERDFIPRVRLALFHQPYHSWRGSFAINRHAAFERPDLMLARLSLHLDFINLRRPLRAGDEVSEIAVVGEQQQPFGVEIQPPDRMYFVAIP